VPLHPDVISDLRSLDLDQEAAHMRSAGLGDWEINARLARLHEVQSQGMITGKAWGGRIYDLGWVRAF
jgi:hypothetical protein